MKQQEIERQIMSCFNKRIKNIREDRLFKMVTRKTGLSEQEIQTHLDILVSKAMLFKPRSCRIKKL